MPPAKSQQPPPPGFIRGSECNISHWSGGELVLDTKHQVQCFIGYCREDQSHNAPWYSPSVALNDRDGRSSYRFVELRRGVLRHTPFLRDEEYYKVIDDRFVILPRGTSSYFGVICKGDRSEDEELTRQVFGGTMQEFELIACALARTVGRPSDEMLRLPRLTFSKTRQNHCDVSGCLIPENFPYVAFNDAPYDWGHVSLFGLYRLLAFMCSTGESPVKAALEDAGVSVELMQRFVDSGTNARPMYPRGTDL
jgi:hypothetical protein